MPNSLAKILVVEDDRQLRKALVTTLTDNGYEVISAKDGEEGINLATTELPSLIILDLLMPKINGHELLKLLRQNPKARHIPVIVLTNDISTESIQEAKDKGAPAYFSKASTSLSEILEVVSYHLSK
jgi:CheY-like chemotaxis protein